MMSTGGSYAVKKRKKPVRKSPKPQPPEGTKSNPSKRHRDRLNQELSKLTNLLPFPEDVRARLDKLSILRLIVGYLKVKDYFSATLKDSSAACSANPAGSEYGSPQVNAELFSEGDLLLQALNGFLMAVTEDGYVFYVSPTVQDYLGFHQSDVIYQSVFELIHKEDRHMFQSQLHWSPDPKPISREAKQDTSPLPQEEFPPFTRASVDSHQHLPLEDSPYLERSFVCRFRCLLDNSSGFLELNFHGHLKFLPGQNNRSEDGILMSPQLTLFAIATPHQPLTILELQTKTFLFQTKHKLDFTPIACDSRGKVVLGYTESELCRRGSGYQFIHAADMMYCAENHLRLIQTGESGLTVFRLLTKQAGWLWVQSNAHLVFRGGQPECIVARQRALTNAEGEEHLQKRALQLPFTFTTGEAILYESSLPGLLTTVPARKKRSRARKGLPTDQGPVHPESLLGAMMQQNESMYLSCIAPKPQGSPLGKWMPDDKCEDKEEEEGKEGSSLLTLFETLLEKDMEEQPDLCFTLQHLGVADLEQHPWEKNLLQVDSDPMGPQNCHLLPPSQGVEPQREKRALFHDDTHVTLSPLASTTSQPTPRPQSSLGLDVQAMEVSPPQNLGTGPSHPQAHHQHLLISGTTTPSPTLESPLRNTPQQQLGNAQAGSLNFGMSQKQAISDHRDVTSPLAEASSPSRAALMFKPSCTAALSSGENVPEHLAHPAPGILDFCQESVPQTLTHSGQCQVASDPAFCVSPCGSHLSGSIWDSSIQGQPGVVPMEVGSGQGAGQAWPDPFSHQWVVDSWFPWTRPAGEIPPSFGRGEPLLVQGAPGTPEEIPRGQESPPHCLGVHQLSGSSARPSQELLHGPLPTLGSYSADMSSAAEQQQWMPVGLQTQEPCRKARGGLPGLWHLASHLRETAAHSPWLRPFPSLDSESSSLGTGHSPAEPPRQCQDRLLGPAPGALGRSQVPSSLALPPCPPDPTWPPTSLQGSCDIWL